MGKAGGRADGPSAASALEEGEGRQGCQGRTGLAGEGCPAAPSARRLAREGERETSLAK